MNETAGELGFALAIAALGSLGTAVYRNQIDLPGGISAETADAARESLAGATNVAAALPGLRGRAGRTDATGEAFTTGLRMTAATSAVLLAGVAALIVMLLRATCRPAAPRAVPPPRRGAPGT